MYENFFTFIQQLVPELEIDRKLLEQRLNSKRVKKGEFIFHTGEICEYVCITLKGCIRTFVIKDEKEYTLFFHTENQTFGDYESFQKHKPSCFYCQAVEDSEIIIFNQEVMGLLEEYPGGQKLLRRVAEDLAFMLRDKVISLFMQNPEERYLQLIDSNPQLLQRIPQYYLASYLGIEPESLSRLKRRLQQKVSTDK